MKLQRLPVWYSIISCVLSVLAVLLLLLQMHFGFAPLAAIDFFLLLGCYLNCLPLAIVSIFMFFRKGMRWYSLANLAAIVLVLCFAVKVFGKSL